MEISNGQLPTDAATVSGTGLGDSNHMADAEGLSHCVNEIRFADGGSLTVIDNQNMGINRCQQFGKTISVSTFNDAWVIGLTEDARASRQNIGPKSGNRFWVETDAAAKR